MGPSTVRMRAFCWPMAETLARAGTPRGPASTRSTRRLPITSQLGAAQRGPGFASIRVDSCTSARPLASLTASSLCVWSARQHRVVLGYYPRHQASLESDGSNVRLCWHPDSHTLAVSTSGSFVYLYQVQEASGGSAGRQQQALSAEDCARLLQGQFRVSISLTQKVQAAVRARRPVARRPR